MLLCPSCNCLYLSLAFKKYRFAEHVCLNPCRQFFIFSCWNIFPSSCVGWKATRFCEFKLKNLNMLLVDTYKYHHYKKAQKMCLIFINKRFYKFNCTLKIADIFFTFCFLFAYTYLEGLRRKLCLVI